MQALLQSLCITVWDSNLLYTKVSLCENKNIYIFFFFTSPYFNARAKWVGLGLLFRPTSPSSQSLLWSEQADLYKDDTFHGRSGICGYRSGIVLGYLTKTVQQIVPGSDKYKPLLDENRTKDTVDSHIIQKINCMLGRINVSYLKYWK